MACARLLVVDDDRDFAESIAMRCRGLGLYVDTASTPLAAVMSMGTHPPDLLCFDVNMPTCNGLDLCEYLVRSSPGPAPHVIILTGQKDLETIQRSRRLRTRYVYKATDVWHRLRPVIEEMLALGQHARGALATHQAT